eukprot:6075169-Prymnesium_polylepis.1
MRACGRRSCRGGRDGRWRRRGSTAPRAARRASRRRRGRRPRSARRRRSSSTSASSKWAWRRGRVDCRGWRTVVPWLDLAAPRSTSSTTFSISRV